MTVLATLLLPLRRHQREVFIRRLEAQQAVEVRAEVGEGVSGVFVDAGAFAQECVYRAKKAAFHGMPFFVRNCDARSLAPGGVSRAIAFGFRQILATWEGRLTAIIHNPTVT
jgi:hypothetical protein